MVLNIWDYGLALSAVLIFAVILYVADYLMSPRYDVRPPLTAPDPDEVCHWCRNHFLSPTRTNRAEFCDPVQTFPCGHWVGKECFQQLIANGTTDCPICRRPWRRVPRYQLLLRCCLLWLFQRQIAAVVRETQRIRVIWQGFSQRCRVFWRAYGTYVYVYLFSLLAIFAYKWSSDGSPAPHQVAPHQAASHQPTVPGPHWVNADVFFWSNLASAPTHRHYDAELAPLYKSLGEKA